MRCAVQRYGENSRQRLDMAVLGFFQNFRKVYIGEQVRRLVGASFYMFNWALLRRRGVGFGVGGGCWYLEDVAMGGGGGGVTAPRGSVWV